MDDIAAEAGIAKPIVYRHFADKDGLYHALWERYVETLMAKLREALRTAADPHTRLEATIGTYLSFVEEEREAYRFLMHRVVREQPEGGADVAGFIRRVAGEVSVVVREELGRAGVDTGGVEPWAYGLVGMVYLAGDWWLETGTMSRSQLVDYLVTLVWGGFGRLATAEPARRATGSGGRRRARSR